MNKRELGTAYEKKAEEYLEEIELYAKSERVPIMMKDGIEYLCNYIKENNIKSILEIGSAIGYSAIKMALVSDDIKITTIEKDENRYKTYVLANNIMYLSTKSSEEVSKDEFDGNLSKSDIQTLIDDDDLPF